LCLYYILVFLNVKTADDKLSIMDGDNKATSVKYLRCAHVDDMENILLLWDLDKFL